MLPNTSACIAILFAGSSAIAQTLNPWPQKNFGGDGNYTDGDVNTIETKDYIPYYGGGSFSLLFNTWITMSGLYIQSPGDDFITDYKVQAVIGDDYALLDVGRVCGATGNFTFVPLINPRDGQPPRSLTWLVNVSGTRENSTTYRINEMWPVFPGDEVVDPENTSSCPAAVSA
ncbi:hypothetical protein KVR01_007472 [Diaporthe batatas]|uniref:uncharacterized protein n=1 Tax=Diaporthe batatas TaxID=748121 RepID=UPI001D049F10|nr:uncharacterized protein KVR01_007472 [Diaporthe batatas]KAG8162994.1 hypothetical protein KVR01_007472 [Diaporthe batatas]